MNIWISGLYQYLFLGLQYHLQAPDQGWTLQRKEGLTTKGGRSQSSGSMGAFLMDAEGWDDALHTPLDRHTPSCIVQTNLLKKTLYGRNLQGK